MFPQTCAKWEKKKVPGRAGDLRRPVGKAHEPGLSKVIHSLATFSPLTVLRRRPQPHSRTMLPRSPATAGRLLRSLQRPRGFSSAAANLEAAKADDEKIVASVLFERHPVVIPKIHPGIYAFQEFSYAGPARLRVTLPHLILLSLAYLAVCGFGSSLH
jgi:hypothetical protein